MNIEQIFKDFLKEHKTLFLNETHFQLMFCIYLKGLKKVKEVIVEYPIEYNDSSNINMLKKNKYLDILIITESNEKIGIELKYKTKKKEIKIYDKLICLKNQGAYNETRAGFLLDIMRLENFIKNKEIDKGYFIALSNNNKIWDATKRNVGDKKSRLYEFKNNNLQVKKISGNITFNTKVMNEKYSNSIKLKGAYKLKKQIYNDFLFSLVEVL